MRASLFFFLACCAWISSMGQEQSIALKFGFKAGINHTHMNYRLGVRPAGQMAPESRSRPGITAGFLINVPVTSKLSLQPEYLFSLRRTFLPISETTNQFYYLGLPVLAKLQITKSVAILIGPEFDLLIHATQADGSRKRNITHDVEERNFGATGGLQYSINQVLFIDARYMRGISNVGVGQRSDVEEFKFQVFELTAGIRF